MKIKKALIPLLIIVCIPLFLAGCSSSVGIIKFSKDNNQAWYYVTPQKKIRSIYIIKNNKLTTAIDMDDQPADKIISSNSSQVLSKVTAICDKETAKAEKSPSSDAHGAEVEKDLDFSYTVGKSSETITYGYENESSFTLTDPNTKIKIGGKTYTGYKYKDNNDSSNDGYLVTNTNQKLGFDKAKN